MARKKNPQGSVSPLAVAALVGGGLAVLWAATRTSDASAMTPPGGGPPPGGGGPPEPPPPDGDGGGAVDIDPGPPAMPPAGQAPLAPDGASILFLGDEAVFDIYPAFAAAAKAHSWNVGLMSIKGATAKAIDKALGEAKLPTYDVVVLSVGTNDVEKYAHPAIDEAASWPAIFLGARALANRGLVIIYPPAFNRAFFHASLAESEVVVALDEATRDTGAFGPKKGFFRIAPSWWLTPKPELRDDGFLAVAGAKAVADELAFFLSVH